MPKRRLEDLPPVERDSLMVLAYLLVKLQQMNWTSDRLASDVAEGLRRDAADTQDDEDVTAIVDRLDKTESDLMKLQRTQVLRRALTVWAERWEDDNGGALMAEVRDLAEAMLEDESPNLMRSLLTVIKGGKG